MAGVFPIHLGVMNAQEETLLTCDLITPQPQFCAGFRRLLADWDDTRCATVRNTSSGITSGIGFDSGEYFDTDAYETFIGVDSGSVATLYDQTGGGNSMTCDSTSYQPTIEAADFDSNKYAMRFNGTNRHLYTDLGSGNNVDLNESTTFIVFKRYGGGWQLLSFSKNKGWNSGNGVVAGNSYVRSVYGSYASNNWQSGEATDRHVVHQTYDQPSSLIKGYIDDDQSASKTYSGNQDNHRYIALSAYRITPPWLGVNSQIYEVIHYNEVLSDADRETIRDDIMNFYGITS